MSSLSCGASAVQAQTELELEPASSMALVVRLADIADLRTRAAAVKR
jgi:hypothetical protein